MRRALDWLSGLEGWRWVLAWVVASTVPVLSSIAALLVVSQLVPEVELVRRGNTVVNYLLILVRVGVSTLLISALAAVGESVLLRSFRVQPRQWIVGSALAATVGALVGVGVVLLVMATYTGSAGPMERLRVVFVAQTLFSALLVGGVQARVLSRAIDGASLWLPIVLAAALARHLVAFEFITPERLGSLAFAYAALIPHALVLGIGLRWLLTRGRSSTLALASTEA